MQFGCVREFFTILFWSDITDSWRLLVDTTSVHKEASLRKKYLWFILEIGLRCASSGVLGIIYELDKACWWKIVILKTPSVKNNNWNTHRILRNSSLRSFMYYLRRTSVNRWASSAFLEYLVLVARDVMVRIGSCVCKGQNLGYHKWLSILQVSRWCFHICKSEIFARWKNIPQMAYILKVFYVERYILGCSLKFGPPPSSWFNWKKLSFF